MVKQTCKDCMKYDTCPFKGEVCVNFQPKTLSNTKKPLIDINVPKILDSSWLENDCYRPC